MRKKFNLSAVRQNLKEKEKQEKNNYTDSRFWKLQVGDENRAKAIIRFLPDKKFAETGGTEGLLYKKYFTHWFRYNIKDDEHYYVNNCSTTIGEECPICQKVKSYYKSPFDSDKKLGGERKRKVKFVTNILIITDPANSANEGKVFLYDYGPMIQKMYSNQMGISDDPDEEFDDEDIKYPFDFEDGCNFELKATPGKGHIKYTYDKSKFKDNSPIFEDLDEDDREEAIDKLVEEQLFDLSDFPASDSFPSAKEVLVKLHKVLNVSLEDSDNTEDEDDFEDEQPKSNNSSNSTPKSEDNDDDFEDDDEDDDEGEEEKTKPKSKTKVNVKTTSDNEDVDEEEFIKGLSS